MSTHPRSSQKSGDARFRVSVRALLLYTLVYACLFAVFGAGPTTAMEMSAATGVVTMFIAVDVWRGSPLAGVPRLARGGAFVGYYSLAIALSGLCCFLVRVITPSPPPPAKSFLAFLAEFEQALAAALGPIILFLGVYLCFSVVGFVASLLAIRHVRSAKWIALASLPGAGWLTVVATHESLTGRTW
jgi:hypothetical protein